MNEKNGSVKNPGEGGYYSRLTGFRRAIPIILAAVAVFIAVCYLAGDTGLLGKWLNAGLLGLFSYGAYAIPVLIILHAIFYAEDHAKSRVLSRTVFSVITVILISSVEYTVIFWNQDPAFTPGQHFLAADCGGFLGSTVAYALVHALGQVGLIIFAVALFSVYVAFFFTSGKRAIVSAVGGIVSGVKELVGGAAKRAKEARAQTRALRVEAKSRKKTRLSREDAKKSEALLDDSFFAVDNGMSELRITELNIHEQRSAATAEQNPTLQSEVFHKSAVREDAEPVSASAGTRTAPHDAPRAGRRFNMDFARGTDLRDDAREPSPASFVYEDDGATTVFSDEPSPFERPASEPRSTASDRRGFGLDESADAVFTSEFDPYSSAINMKAAEGATASRTASRSQGFSSSEEPMDLPTEEEVAEIRRRKEAEREAARRKEAFERSKREAQERYRREQEAAAEARAASQAAEPSPSPARPEPAVAEPVSAEAVTSEPVRDSGVKTVEFNVEQEPTVIKVPSIDGGVSRTYGKPERISDNVEEVAAAVAEAVARSNPAYARSANESVRTTVTESRVSAAEPAVNEPATDLITDEPVPAADPTTVESRDSDFRPYEATVSEPASESSPAAEVLRTERDILSPNHSVASAIRDSAYTVIDDNMSEVTEQTRAASATDVTDEGTTFIFEAEEEPAAPAAPERTADDLEIFGDEDMEDEDLGEDEIIEPEDEDDAAPEEIPPEEQNPDVIRQRAMFPFLDEDPAPAAKPQDEPTPAEPAVVSADESEDEDEPPFDEPVQMKVTEPAPVKKVAEPASEPAKAEPKKPDYSNYRFPPLELLGLNAQAADENAQAEVQENADKLIDTLASFNVTASIKGVDRGPRITRYEVVPAKGVKVSSIMSLQDDIALNLAAGAIRMEAPIPGKSAVGVEIPNKKSSTVRLRELIETEDFRNERSRTCVCMGKDVAGQPVFADIAKMPHALIAGATGMGKSVCINSLMISMLYKARPDEVKFIMIDPKQVEFTMYNGIPHLLVPIVTDVHQAAGTLMWAVEEMERRYTLLQQAAARNIENYNAKVAEKPHLGEPMHRIVIVIDEFAELIMQAKNPVESLVIRIAQKARAAGIHLIIGTQKPVKEVITGLIKSNIPSKFSCKVASNRDSILIFDQSGAEKLLDKGDMLIAFANSLQPLRVQCAFVADEEVEAVMDFLKENAGGAEYDESVMEEIRRAADRCQNNGKGGSADDDDDSERESGEGYLNDKQFLDAVDVAISSRKISTSLIQRRISIGYGKAAKFIDIMEDMGIVGPSNGQRPREVLISEDEWREKLARTMID